MLVVVCHAGEERRQNVEKELLTGVEMAVEMNDRHWTVSTVDGS
jgi:hypothetical protein